MCTYLYILKSVQTRLPSLDGYNNGFGKAAACHWNDDPIRHKLEFLLHHCLPSNTYSRPRQQIDRLESIAAASWLLNYAIPSRTGLATALKNTYYQDRRVGDKSCKPHSSREIVCSLENVRCEESRCPEPRRACRGEKSTIYRAL